MEGINVIGHVSGGMGMGLTARNIATALLDRGFDIAVLDIDPGHGRMGRVKDFDSLQVAAPDLLPHRINLFILGPQVLAHDIVCRPEFARLLSRVDATNAAFTFWELPLLPRGWSRAMEVFDVAIAGSPFVGRALEVSLSDCLVIDGLHPIALPKEVAPDRAKFDLPLDAFVAVVSFDPLSDISRKNPQAAIAAFQTAFPTDERARLVIKLNLSATRAGGSDGIETSLRGLLERACSDRRVRIIDRPMSYGEVLSLYASSDAYLSLHRSEGFGLGLIEAMGLGKPVIATGWSGNRAFMDPTNSCLVGYGLTPVKATNWAYVEAMRGLEPVWAEPLVRDAALWLQRLAADSALAARIGVAAERTFSQYQQRAAKAEFIDQVIALRQHQFVAGRSNERRASILRRLDRARQQIRDDAQTPPQRLLHRICNGYGRHVGWRFSRSPN